MQRCYDQRTLGMTIRHRDLRYDSPLCHPEAITRSKLDPRENRRDDPISRFLAGGSFFDRSSMTCQLCVSLHFPTPFPSRRFAHSARLSPPRALSSGGKGDVRGTFPRTVLSEGFKGRTKIRPLPRRRGEHGLAWRVGGTPPVNFYHISESFVGLASA